MTKKKKKSKRTSRKWKPEYIDSVDMFKATVKHGRELTSCFRKMSHAKGCRQTTKNPLRHSPCREAIESSDTISLFWKVTYYLEKFCLSMTQKHWKPSELAFLQEDHCKLEVLAEVLDPRHFEEDYHIQLEDFIENLGCLLDEREANTSAAKKDEFNDKLSEVDSRAEDARRALEEALIAVEEVERLTSDLDADTL